MKNLKKVNFAVIAVLLGLGLVLTQSAFKSPKSLDDYYAYDVNSADPLNHWVPVDISKMNDPVSGYLCDAPEATEICTGHFETAPDESSDTPDGEIVDGDYIPY